MSILFGLDTSAFYFRYGPIGLALGLLIPAAVAYAIYLYRRQAAIIPRRGRIGATILRAVVYGILILMLFGPVVAETKIVSIPSNILVLLDISESMSIKDHRKDSEELLEAAMALGKVPLEGSEEGSTSVLPADVTAEVREVSRLDLAKGILRLPELEILRTSTENTRVASYTFGDQLAPSVGDDSQPTPWLEAAQATATATCLGDGLIESVDRHGGQSITGVLVLSDGASNEGIDAVDAARRLIERSIPVHTVGIGLTKPDDVRIQTVLVPDTVFYKDRVPVRVLIESDGFDGRSVEVTLTVDEKPTASESIVLSGDAQFVQLWFIPEQKGGQAKLNIAVSAPAGDVAPENNQAERSLNIIDEKIKILYVESEPRWEYRYLRGVFLRDHRLDVKFLLTEGDLDLARASEQYIEKFPDEAQEIFKYDLIVLGDVHSGFFTSTQLERIEELVAKHGGSFLMLAGHRNAPMSYNDNPIAKLLPVKITKGGGHDRVVPTVHPVPTEQGLRSMMVSLSPNEQKTRDTWAVVKPLYDLPRLDGVKAGAADNVLLTLSTADGRSEPYPLVVWQRYGAGKSLFVATDKLWRLRRKHGDEYHSRFWKQAIQFLTLSRLMGENKRIRLATDRRDYRAGEQVQTYANVLDESFAPVEQPSYEVLVETPGQVDPTALSLTAVPGSPGLYQGFYTAAKAGSYRLKSMLADEKFSNTATFEAVGAKREMLQPAMQEQTLRKISELTGGEYLTVRDLPKLQELLHGKARTTSVAEEDSIWDRWYVLLFLVSCLGTEWFVRRRNDAA